MRKESWDSITTLSASDGVGSGSPCGHNRLERKNLLWWMLRHCRGLLAKKPCEELASVKEQLPIDDEMSLEGPYQGQIGGSSLSNERSDSMDLEPGATTNVDDIIATIRIEALACTVDEDDHLVKLGNGE